MQPQDSTADRVLARLAARTHGVVTRAQLVSVSITDEEIKQRVRRGTLIRVHRGVFRVGHTAPSVAAQYLAGADPRMSRGRSPPRHDA
jgi:hypothetical protein